jgi:hypothetical protein
MENPATWNEDVKAVQTAIDDYNRQIAEGSCGFSLAKFIEFEVIAPLREQLENGRYYE